MIEEIGNIEMFLSACVGKNISVSINNGKSISNVATNKLESYLIKDAIIKLKFADESVGKDLEFPLPFGFTRDKKIADFSYDTKLIGDIIDLDNLLDLEEQNSSKSRLYNCFLRIECLS